MSAFLDRLMMAESGGRQYARNPRSTALGPFQFIESTFLEVARRYLAEETAELSAADILALRADPKISRRAAEAYTRENAQVLQSLDVDASYPNLRLAFLLGPGGAARVLKAAPDSQLAELLPPSVIQANPFMATLTAGGLAARSAREISQRGSVQVAGLAPPRGRTAPALVVRCNIALASCKRWVALRTAKVRVPGRQTSGRT